MTAPSKPIPLTVALLLAATGSLAAGGCGGSSADQERLQTEKIEAAKKDAVKQALLEQKAKDAAAQTKDLQKQVNRLKRGRGGSASGSTPSGSSGSGESSASTGGSCGDGVSVNSRTTCPFGRNVRDDYYSSGQDAVVYVHSPATGQDYSMSCSPGSPHTCTGGNNASVTFP